MNYIQALQEKNDELQRKLDEAQTALYEFRKHLSGSKFVNTTAEICERRDWIATADVNRWLDTIQIHLN